MSSFKRKVTSSQPQTRVFPGTRISPTSTSTTITSTGIPSLDDVLGGGIPLSCTLLTLAPDQHSAYGDLVQKYFIAQGMACGQKVCLVEEATRAETLMKECMWLPTDGPWTGHSSAKPGEVVDEDEDDKSAADDKIDIAWRYKTMKKFQTTIDGASSSSSSAGASEYCSTFDLTRCIPEEIILTSTASEQLVFRNIVPDPSGDSVTSKALLDIENVLINTSPDTAVRICVPSLGSIDWDHNSSTKETLRFLHSLRCLLRRFPSACASIALPARLCTDSSVGYSGWVQKLSWLSDASISMSAFSANPSLSLMFPSHHGMVQVHALPVPHTLLPASDKLSVLRGLSASSAVPSSSHGGGENNLAFKCMRKRLVFETLHLDVEGGVGERRTKPSKLSETEKVAAVRSSDETAEKEDSHQDLGPQSHRHPPAAALDIAMEGLKNIIGSGAAEAEEMVKTRKAKKKVAFISDRPELYDF